MDIKKYYEQLYADKVDRLEGMGQFLKKTQCMKTHKEETDPSNRLIFIKEIELITNNFPKQKPPGPDDFSGELYQIFKEEMTPLFYNLFQKILTETPYLILQGQHYSDTKTRHKHYKEGKL